MKSSICSTPPPASSQPSSTGILTPLPTVTLSHPSINISAPPPTITLPPPSSVTSAPLSNVYSLPPSPKMTTQSTFSTPDSLQTYKGQGHIKEVSEK